MSEEKRSLVSKRAKNNQANSHPLLKSKKHRKKAKKRKAKKQVYTGFSQRPTRLLFNRSFGASTRGDFQVDRGRYYFFWVAISLLFFVLVARAVNLQVLNSDFYKKKGDNLITAEVTKPSYRGMLLDRNSQPLAISAPLLTVYFSPRDFARAYYATKRKVLENPTNESYKEDFNKLDLNRLAAVTGIAVTKFQEICNMDYSLDVRDSQAVKRALPAGKGSQYFPLLNKASPEIAEKITSLDIKGIYTEKSYKRYYPQAYSSTQLLGFMGENATSSKKGYRGRSGLELMFQDELAGSDGRVLVLRDAVQTQLKEIKQLTPEVPGKDIKLTIDSRLQYLLYQELEKAGRMQRALWSSGIVVDVHSGEVLAASTWPSYNANNLNDMTGESQRNRVFIDNLEPGSVMKPFTVAAALESGKYNKNTLINTAPGYIRVNGYTVRDHGNLGTISMRTLLKKSSNVASTKIAWSLPADGITGMQKKFGFGAKTGVGFPGEAKGVIVTPKLKQKARRATLSYGYGLEVTLAQIAQAYSALGSGGVFRPLSIVKNPKPVAGEQIISKKNALDIVNMMESVTSRTGTAPAAAIDGYRVAGKTGTSRRIDPKGGYYKDKYRTLFAGIAPVSSPRLAVVVLVEEAQEDQYAGDVAAPVFHNVMKEALRLYNVPFDKPLRKK